MDARFLFAKQIKNEILRAKSHCASNSDFSSQNWIATPKMTSIYKILKDGYMIAGNDLPAKYLTMSYPGNSFDNVYGMLYFEDLKNLPWIHFPAIILHPNIVCDGITFNQGWGGSGITKKEQPITINKSDPKTTVVKKINAMRKYIKNPYTLNKVVIQWPDHHHEILMPRKISVKKYVIGVICPQEDSKKLQGVIKKYNYNINVLTNNFPPPTLVEVLNKHVT